MSARMTGGEALIQSLVREGVDTVFGLPGAQLDWAYDALYAARERIRLYHTRHEQATAYMADGFARTTGRPGVCMVVPGPGVLNASAGLATAYACSSPVVCVAGQIDSRGIDRGFGLLHEVPHQEAVLGSVTKWSARACSVTEIPGLVNVAFNQVRRERPRPVAIEIPPDILQHSDQVTLLESTAVVPVAGDPELLRQAADLLHAAERPVIYSGGGTLAAAAWDELRTLAELLEAPVVMSVDGRGALSDLHPLGHTGLSGQQLIESADVVLAVGTRFWQPSRVWGRAPGARVVRIDADPDELVRLGVPTIAIQADARAALAALLAVLHGSRKRVSRRDELQAMKVQAAECLKSLQPQAAYAAAIRAALPEDGILVMDLTQVGFYATVGFPVYVPRTFIGPGYQGTLGSGFTMALGAQVGNPGRAVVTVVGDGGYLYSLGELATQKQHGLNVVSIVFNDGAFGNVKRTQQLAFGGRLIASELDNPDFTQLARAFGIHAERVVEPDDLQAALRSALAAQAPALIEVSVGAMSNVWPVIWPAGGAYPLLLDT